MERTIEIRWHGRGGQGTKTAALLLADAAFEAGRFVQGFPEYGPERMGAPITAYNRIGKQRIRVHSNIYSPDYVVVVDETLIGSINVAAGLKEEGALIVNTSKTPEDIRMKMPGYGGKIHTIDARTISEESLGKNFPNTPMLGAVVQVSGVIDAMDFIETMKASFGHKFASKPHVVEGNMAALIRAMKEIRCEEVGRDE